MALVVDTSVILAVVLNEPTKAVLIRLTTGADLIAPLSLHWEIGNALSAMLKRKRITEAEAQQALVKIPQDQGMTLEQQITYALRSFARE